MTALDPKKLAETDTPEGLLREAADLLDALDLGVESDGIAALVRRIHIHLAGGSK